MFLQSYSGRIHFKARVILQQTCPLSYEVQVGQKVKHRHALDIQRRDTKELDESEEEEFEKDIKQQIDFEQ